MGDDLNPMIVITVIVRISVRVARYTNICKMLLIIHVSQNVILTPVALLTRNNGRVDEFHKKKKKKDIKLYRSKT